METEITSVGEISVQRIIKWRKRINNSKQENNDKNMKMTRTYIIKLFKKLHYNVNSQEQPIMFFIMSLSTITFQSCFRWKTHTLWPILKSRLWAGRIVFMTMQRMEYCKKWNGNKNLQLSTFYLL